MSMDPIVDEVRRVREEYAARFHYDLAAISKDLREKQEQSGRKVVHLPAKRLPGDERRSENPAA